MRVSINSILAAKVWTGPSNKQLGKTDERRTTMHSTIDLSKINAGIGLLLICFYELRPCGREVSTMTAIGREVFDEPVGV